MCLPNELNQVWANIISNAIYAMNYNGTLTISTSVVNNNILVSFHDSGPGIPVEAQSKIFSDFYTTKPVGEGIGIGLNISKKIIDKHNGNIYFKSDSENGTTFYVELPIVFNNSVIGA